MYILDGETWNDNATEPSHTPHEAILRLSVRHIIRASAWWLACVSASCLAVVLPRQAAAQSSTSLLTDGSVLPRHGFGVTLQSSWTRFDELLGGKSSTPRNLGASFNTDSLGSMQIPALAASENAIRALSGTPAFQLTAGQLTTSANSRIVTAPVILQYGVTSRLTMGLVVPLVETRTTLVSRLNPHPGAANVGPNPYLTGKNYGAPSALVQSFTAAAASLQALLSQCQQAPTTAGCSMVLSQAPSLLTSSTAFSSALATLYGTDPATPGQAFVPLNSSNVQSAINKEIQGFRDSYQTLLNSDVIGAGTIAGAIGPAANGPLDTLLGRAGYDTLGIADHASVGDISIGATLQLVNTYGDSIAAAEGATMFRFAVNGTARIGTGQPGNRNRLFDNATGYGQPGAVVGAAADILFHRRYSLSMVGSYTAQFGSVDVSRIPNFENDIFPLTGPVSGTYSAGNVVMLSLVPRIELSRYFSFNGQYQVIHVAQDTYTPGAIVNDTTGIAFPAAFSSPPGLAAATAQQVGLGFAYSTVSSSDRGPGRIPFEVSFRHLETIAATGGPTPKTFQDQLTLKVFFGKHY
jgi:hypothetical protein